MRMPMFSLMEVREGGCRGAFQPAGMSESSLVGRMSCETFRNLDLGPLYRFVGRVQVRRWLSQPLEDGMFMCTVCT